ncbi:carboxylesterase/lipase family protein, partial [Thermodesulfobacteriota bacterium]
RADMNSLQRNLGVTVIGILLFLGGCSDDPAPTSQADPALLWTGDPTTLTRYGTVRGFEDESDTWAWKGIPYARPPVDGLRWKAPQDPDPWMETFEAESFGEVCTQYFPFGDFIYGCEDCLYLNLWRPRTSERDLPVYFWIHGGGSSIGSGSLPDYRGMNLAGRKNMVVVTINYRLGPMGWFSHPALRSGARGAALDDSGNYGTMDMIKALSWVRDNIEAFGGDPERVTIGGESAGGRNVQSLLISPLAENLFHGAVSESGGASTISFEAGELSARRVIKELLVLDGIAADEEEAEAYLNQMTDVEVEAYLRAQSSDRLLSRYIPWAFGMISFPNIFRDGTVIEETGFDTLEAGTYPNKVPVILGSNKEEKKLFMAADPYFECKPELYQIVATYGSDAWKASGVDSVAKRLRMHPDQPDVYAYQFLWGAGGDVGESQIPDPWGFKLGACHTLEIPFFFGNNIVNVAMQLLVFTRQNRPGRETLTDAMMSYLAGFVHTGNPNASGRDLPTWGTWTNDEAGPKCVLFNVDGDQALDVRMSTVELTEEGLRERLVQEVPEPLYSEACAYLGWCE